MYLTEIFGSKVFNDDVMRQRLPAVTYKALNTTIKQNKRLDPEVANVVANAMKDWALENGATHFTHWFQPLNGVTAEKHDSFISPDHQRVLRLQPDPRRTGCLLLPLRRHPLHL